MRKMVLGTMMMAGLGGCGGGSGNGSTDSLPPPDASAPQIETGYFKGLTARGLGYVAGSQSGVTDMHGGFRYEAGKPVTFFVGTAEGLSIGTLEPAEIVTLLGLPADRRTNAMRMLMMLDHDGDPNNGVTLSSSVQARAMHWPRIDLGGSDLAAVVTQIQSDAISADGTSHLLPSAEVANTQLTEAVRCTYAGLYRGSIEPTGTASSAGRPDRQGLLGLLVFPPDSHVFGGGYTAALGAGELVPFMDIHDSRALQITEPGFSGVSGLVQYAGSFLSQNEITGAWERAPDSTGRFSAVRQGGSPAALYRFGTYYVDQADGARQLLLALEIDSNGEVYMGIDDGLVDGGVLHGHQADELIEASSGSSTGVARWTFSGNLVSTLQLNGVLQDAEHGRTYPFAPTQLQGCVM